MVETTGTRDGTALADATKAKIRNVFSVVFNHAIRYEWLEQSRKGYDLAMRLMPPTNKMPPAMRATVNG